MKKKLLVLGLVCMLGFSSCEKPSIEPVKPETEDTTQKTKIDTEEDEDELCYFRIKTTYVSGDGCSYSYTQWEIQQSNYESYKQSQLDYIDRMEEVNGFRWFYYTFQEYCGEKPSWFD